MRIEVVHGLTDEFVDDVYELVMDLNPCKKKTIPPAIFDHFNSINK